MGAPSIPVMKVGNTVYEIKDLTAREHLIEVRDDQPTSEDNKLWVRETETEHSIPTWEEFQELYRKYEVLKERIDRFDALGLSVVGGKICIAFEEETV